MPILFTVYYSYSGFSLCFDLSVTSLKELVYKLFRHGSSRSERK